MKKISKGKPILEEALREMERFSNNEEIQDLFSIEMMERSREQYNKEKGKKEAEMEAIELWQKFMKASTLDEKRKIAKGNLILEDAIKEIEKAKNGDYDYELFTKEMLDKSREQYKKEKAKKEAKKREEKREVKGARNKAIEIAKNLIKEKVDIDIIVKTTGLTKEEIEKF